MALTAKVKDELARVQVDKVSARKAEIATTLRFAGGLHIVAGRIVIEAELDTAASARRASERAVADAAPPRSSGRATFASAVSVGSRL